MAWFHVYFSKFVFADEASRQERRRPPHCSHCQRAYASQRVIGWELSCTCIVMNHNVWFAENSRAPALWRHDRDINSHNMAMLLIFQGQLAMFTEENSALNRNVNVTKVCQFKKDGLEILGRWDSSLVNALSSVIKLQSLKLHFYHHSSFRKCVHTDH